VLVFLKLVRRGFEQLKFLKPDGIRNLDKLLITVTQLKLEEAVDLMDVIEID